MGNDAATITGLHHVSILTGNAELTHRFWTDTLGLQLSAKSVNQEQHGMYHLFYSDAAASPGTLATFFDMPLAAAERPGAGSFSRITLRVEDAAAVDWWAARLEEHGVEHGGSRTEDGRRQLQFRSPAGTALALTAGSAAEAGGLPVPETGIPAGFHIRGLGPAQFTSGAAAAVERFLGLLGFEQDRTYALERGTVRVQAVPEAGPAAEIHVLESSAAPRRYGSGGVHHLALTVPEIRTIRRLLARAGAAGHQVSGVLDRGWFHSGYVTGPEGIIIELATPGPGFRVAPGGIPLDGPVTLPPFLEADRKAIEGRLRPLMREGENR